MTSSLFPIVLFLISIGGAPLNGADKKGSTRISNWYTYTNKNQGFEVSLPIQNGKKGKVTPGAGDVSIDSGGGLDGSKPGDFYLTVFFEARSEGDVEMFGRGCKDEMKKMVFVTEGYQCFSESDEEANDAPVWRTMIFDGDRKLIFDLRGAHLTDPVRNQILASIKPIPVSN